MSLYCSSRNDARKIALVDPLVHVWCHHKHRWIKGLVLLIQMTPNMYMLIWDYHWNVNWKIKKNYYIHEVCGFHFGKGWCDSRNRVSCSTHNQRHTAHIHLPSTSLATTPRILPHLHWAPPDPLAILLFFDTWDTLICVTTDSHTQVKHITGATLRQYQTKALYILRSPNIFRFVSILLVVIYNFFSFTSLLLFPLATW